MSQNLVLPRYRSRLISTSAPLELDCQGLIVCRRPEPKTKLSHPQKVRCRFDWRPTRAQTHQQILRKTQKIRLFLRLIGRAINNSMLSTTRSGSRLRSNKSLNSGLRSKFISTRFKSFFFAKSRMTQVLPTCLAPRSIRDLRWADWNHVCRASVVCRCILFLTGSKLSVFI